MCRCVHLCISACVHERMRAFVHEAMWASVHVSMWAWLRVCICAWMHMCVCACVDVMFSRRAQHICCSPGRFPPPRCIININIDINIINMYINIFYINKNFNIISNIFICRFSGFSRDGHVVYRLHEGLRRRAPQVFVYAYSVHVHVYVDEKQMYICLCIFWQQILNYFESCKFCQNSLIYSLFAFVYSRNIKSNLWAVQYYTLSCSILS